MQVVSDGGLTGVEWGTSEHVSWSGRIDTLQISVLDDTTGKFGESLSDKYMINLRTWVGFLTCELCASTESFLLR